LGHDGGSTDRWATASETTKSPPTRLNSWRTPLPEF
jgi:hypothetical protein